MILTVILLAILGAVQQPASPPGAVVRVRHEMPRPDSVSGERASLPMVLVEGFPTVRAFINGKGPFTIGIDTGAMGGAHLTDRLAAALGLAAFGEARASDPSGRNPVAVKLYRLDSFRLGGVEIKGWVSTAGGAPPGKLASLDAIMGMGAFDGYVVTIDYAGRRFALDRGAISPPDGEHSFHYDDPLPVVPLTVEGHSIAAHLDTGNVRFPVIVPQAFAAGLAHANKARPIGQAHTVSNVIDMFAMPVDGAVMVGAASVAATEVGYPSVIEMANIGSLALVRMVVRVDPANKRISLASLDEVEAAGAAGHR